MTPGPEVGLVEWFHFGDEPKVREVMSTVDDLGVRLLRTGFSWADFERGDADGPAWFDYLVREQLGERIRRGQLDVLFNFAYTPQHRARTNKNGDRTTACPPRRLRDYARFVERMLIRYGDLIRDVELLNEMDISPEWDRALDPQWHKLARTLRHAGRAAHRHGRRTVLGGPTRAAPVLVERLGGSRLLGRGALRHMDVVGLHGFPGTWDTSVTHASDWRWRGWATEVGLTRSAGRRIGADQPIWVTETGSATHDDPSGRTQLEHFLTSHGQLRDLGVERMYWYSVTDLDDHRSTINNVITGESREDNPHSHSLGIKAPLLEHLNGHPETYFGAPS
jgi:CDP-paratose 2-epimerase